MFLGCRGLFIWVCWLVTVGLKESQKERWDWKEPPPPKKERETHSHIGGCRTAHPDWPICGLNLHRSNHLCLVSIRKLTGCSTFFSTIVLEHVLGFEQKSSWVVLSDMLFRRGKFGKSQQRHERTKVNKNRNSAQQSANKCEQVQRSANPTYGTGKGSEGHVCADNKSGCC